MRQINDVFLRLNFILLELVPQSIIYVAAVSVITITAWLTHRFANKQPAMTFGLRKLLHFVSILVCSWVIIHYHSPLLTWVFGLCTILLTIIVRYRLLSVSKGNSYGIALFSLGFFILLAVGVDPRVVGLSGYILAISDSIAGLVGVKLKSRVFTAWAEPKSVGGSAAFLLCTIVILSAQSFFQFSLAQILLISLISMLAECFSYRGSDNFSVLLTAACLIAYCI